MDGVNGRDGGERCMGWVGVDGMGEACGWGRMGMVCVVVGF